MELYVTPTWTKIEFSLFVIGQILSIPCYLFVIYHLVANKIARRALYNHVIIILLIFNFIDLTINLSMTVSYLHLGYVTLFSPAICLIWQYVDYGMWYGGVSLMFWTSIERHILVFHPNLVRTMPRRLFIHYVPLAFFSLYTPTLYFYLIIIYPCDRVFLKTSLRCGSMCYSVNSYWFIWYDSLINYTVPIILIAVFSGILILRFIKQKRRLQQTSKWRVCRKMIIQLVLVSAAYLIFDLPYIIIVIVQFGYPNFGSNVLFPYISHMTYVPAIVLPYATLLALPRLKDKLRVSLTWKRNRQTVAPATLVD
jgi:hypothetical protein